MKKHDKKYHMLRKLRTKRFPYTEVRTKRGTDACPYRLADDLLNWLAWEFVEPAKWPWVFRGTTRHNYRLESSLDRKLRDRAESGIADSDSAIDRQSAEDYLISQFKKSAQHFSDAAIVQDNKLEWLALMQHYGAPTRFLDFTRSPYVACYFALEEIQKAVAGQTKNCAIWAIDTRWLIRKSVCRVRGNEALSECSERSLFDGEFLANNFRNLFESHERLVLPVVPPRSNFRLLAQQGVFLCPGIKAGFEANFEAYSDDAMTDHVFKIIIERRIRTELLSELRLMNISRATLFPDLQGYAQSLAHDLQYRALDEIEWSR